ncbi:MAG TPA: stage III sporulation protein AG [Candidatus Avamphibacillus intestinigallinarum]|nr:stage III sporulation protein AG [Candidatus Avamphibacillus intestinigallinarum]
MKEKWESLKKLISNIPSKNLKYSIVIAIIGICLLLISNVLTGSNNKTTDVIKESNQEQSAVETSAGTNKDETVMKLEKTYEADLEKMLEKIKGISKVEVMVNLDSTKVDVYEKNLISGKQTTDESDTNGGKRIVEDDTEETQTVLVREGDKEVPLKVQTKKPKVRGVFVIANGVEQAKAKKWVIESTSRVLEVPSHRVSVIPKE